jgi:hypothetical protein
MSRSWSTRTLGAVALAVLGSLVAIGVTACSRSTPAVPVVGVLRGLSLPGWTPYPHRDGDRQQFVIRYSADTLGDSVLFRALGPGEISTVTSSLISGAPRDPNDPRPWERDWTPIAEAAFQPQSRFPMAKFDLARGTVAPITDQEWSSAGTKIFWPEVTGTFRDRIDPTPGDRKFSREWFGGPGRGTWTSDGMTMRGPGTYLSKTRFSPCHRYEAQIWYDASRFGTDANYRSYVVIVDRVTRHPVTPGVMLDCSPLDRNPWPRWTPDSRYIIMYGQFEGKVWIYPNTAWTPDNGPRPASVGPLPPNLQAPPPSPNIVPL